MKADNSITKDNLIKRLRRIEGQVRGVQKMIEDERDCREIVQQLVSIRSAVQGATYNFLQEQASNCLLNPEQEGDQRAMMAELITLLEKAS